MIVRLARVEDAPAMARVNVDTSAPEHRDWLEESARNWVRSLREIADGACPRNCIYIAEQAAGKVVGFAIGGPTGMDAPEGTGEVYNLSVDEKTHKPSATIVYDVVNTATNKEVVHTTESTEQMGNVGDQVTLQKSLSASNLEPGSYRIEIKVNDNISKQTVDPTATFTVE